MSLSFINLLNFYLDRCYKIVIPKYFILLCNLYFKISVNNKCEGTNFKDYLTGFLWTAFIKANTFYSCLVTLLYFETRSQTKDNFILYAHVYSFFPIYRLVNIIIIQVNTSGKKHFRKKILNYLVMTNIM